MGASTYLASSYSIRKLVMVLFESITKIGTYRSIDRSLMGRLSLDVEGNAVRGLGLDLKVG